MKLRTRTSTIESALLATAVAWLLLAVSSAIAGPRQTTSSTPPSLTPLPVEHLRVQGLGRTVRFYRPARLAESPSLVIVLHGSGGDGERFRHLTGGSFDRLADEQGILIAYPDALGGQWNGCRLRAPYHDALQGIDEAAFLRAVVARAKEIAGSELTGEFAVGYSNGGHLVFRLALEAPGDFDAFAAIGANLPVPDERDCKAVGVPVSILLISGTDDPINPWGGGEVRLPDGRSLGRVLSAEATTGHFRGLAETAGQPAVERLDDVVSEDGVRLETYRWSGEGEVEVLLLKMYGGGHTLPCPNGAFPMDLVGRTSRDLDGAQAIWDFLARHRRGG